MTEVVHSAQGEDRSSFQQIQPWTANSFGFAKATEATDWKDPTFAANWAALRDEGKPRGAYHFFHPQLDPQAQAQFFMSVVQENGLEPGDMLVVDSEVTAGADGTVQFSDPNGMQRSNVPLVGTLASTDLVGSGTLAFLEAVEVIIQEHPEHHPRFVYTNLSVGALLDSCSHFHLWIAYPSGTAPASVRPWSHWTFWQWGFGGGPGGGDRDAYNGTAEELNAWISSLKSPPSSP